MRSYKTYEEINRIFDELSLKMSEVLGGYTITEILPFFVTQASLLANKMNIPKERFLELVSQNYDTVNKNKDLN